MITVFKNWWSSISRAGLSEGLNRRQANSTIAINKAWAILMVIQTLCLASHIYNGLVRTAGMTTFYIAGLLFVHLLMRLKRVNAAKISAIGVINLNTFLMAIFLGPQTRIIDFLLLTALLPLYLFEIHNRRFIFWGMAISIIPFATYQYCAPLFTPYALPISEQLVVSGTTSWVLILCLVALLYLIYDKNLSYEKDVNATENRLIEQKKLYERILEQIPIDIVTFDKELRYTYVNSTAVKDPQVRQWLIGKTNAEYFKSRNLDLNAAYERDRILHEALALESKVETEEAMVDRHGHQRHSIKGASPVYSDNGKDLLCLIGYSLDITGIKQAEQKLREYAVELERKNEDLKHFVHATSHDLKSPLRNIVSYLQLLERRNATVLDADSKEMIGFTIKSVKLLNQLINDIYQYSVADSSEQQAVETDMNCIVKNVLLQNSELITAKSAVVEVKDLPALTVVPSHMEMLFGNLIGNALKYNTSLAPAVTISSEIQAENLIVHVADNGIGVEPQYQKKIFEMFRRLHSAQEYEGTGMGLALCKKIIETYGGKIWVESGKQGSVFSFSIPLKMMASSSDTTHEMVPYNLALTG